MSIVRTCAKRASKRADKKADKRARFAVSRNPCWRCWRPVLEKFPMLSGKLSPPRMTWPASSDGTVWAFNWPASRSLRRACTSGEFLTAGQARRTALLTPFTPL